MLRRAWQGGLRLIVALAVNSHTAIPPRPEHGWAWYRAAGLRPQSSSKATSTL
jgi:hypothetical protein